MREKKREVIVYTDEILTPKVRKEYKKTHPGKRLCFHLRYPNFPLIVSAIAVLISVVNLIIKAVFQ